MVQVRNDGGDSFLGTPLGAQNATLSEKVMFTQAEQGVRLLRLDTDPVLGFSSESAIGSFPGAK